MRHNISGSPVHDRSHQDQPSPPAGDAPARASTAPGQEASSREPGSTAQGPSEPSTMLDEMSSKLRRGEAWVEHELERPGVGAVAVGTALVVAAATVGVGEAVVGAIGAYAVYRMLRRRKAERAPGS